MRNNFYPDRDDVNQTEVKNILIIILYYAILSSSGGCGIKFGLGQIAWFVLCFNKNLFQSV